MNRLQGVNEPEKKRKIIGGTYMFAPLITRPNFMAGYLYALTRYIPIDLFQKEAIRIEPEAEDILIPRLYPDVYVLVPTQPMPSVKSWPCLRIESVSY